MIYIENNALNKIFVDVSSATGNTPDFLWNLKNSQGVNVKNFIPRDITSTYPSQYAGKYKVFEFSTIPTLPENLTPVGTSVVNIHLPNLNQFWLGIYEQSGIVNLNPNNAVKVVNSLAFSFWDKTSQYYTGNTSNTADNVIYYESGGIFPTPTPSQTSSPTPTPTNTPTPQPSSSPTPTQTGTPTPTPTPSSTPPDVFNLGSGFDDITQAVFIDGSDNIFVGGNFYGYDGTFSQGGLVKLSRQGVIDTIFNSGVLSSLGNVGSVYKIVEDETGDYIYIIGAWALSPARIAKVDKITGLNVWNSTIVNSTIRDIVVDSGNGDVYIVGNFTNVNGVGRNRIAKLDKFGSLITTAFTGSNFNNQVANMIMNRNGNLVITGAFTTYNGLSAPRLIEIDTTTYTNTGLWGTGAATSNLSVYQRQDNGEYIFSLQATTINGVSVPNISKWSELGVNIPYISYPTAEQIATLFLDEVNDYIYISDIALSSDITRLDYTTGTSDTTFETNIGSVLPTSFYNSGTNRYVIKIDSQNKIYWAGNFTFLGGVNYNRFIRLNQDGTSNTTTT